MPSPGLAGACQKLMLLKATTGAVLGGSNAVLQLDAELPLSRKG